MYSFNARIRMFSAALYFTQLSVQCTATHCNALQRIATHCNALQHIATHCHALQRTATHCATLPRTATHCHTLQRTATHCNALQRTATHCNALRRTATHCNALQRTTAMEELSREYELVYSSKFISITAVAAMKPSLGYFSATFSSTSCKNAFRRILRSWRRVYII